MESLAYAFSCITVPTEVDAQHPMSRSPRSLQDRKHNCEPNKIPAVPVRLISQCRVFVLADAHGYRDQVEEKGNFVSQGKSRGNENRRWHGTTRTCAIGDKGVTDLCSSPSCSLCCIIKNSFDLSFFSRKTNFGRFGAGIYTSSTSSKFVPALFNLVGFTFSWSWFDLLGRIVIRITVALPAGRRCC